MKSESKRYTVKKILDLLKNQMLRPNYEYQRGPVWKPIQKKKLVDSVMRGYPLPVIYLHHVQREIDDMRRDDLEIIDGQQRIRSLEEFHDGKIRLFDPVTDDEEARFPVFLKDQPCPWGGRHFSL